MKPLHLLLAGLVAHVNDDFADPSTWVLKMASTCQTRVSSYPQLCSRKVLTVSLVGETAVKFAGSGLGNTGAAGGGAVGGIWDDVAGA